jgi:hypothetical protein
MAGRRGGYLVRRLRGRLLDLAVQTVPGLLGHGPEGFTVGAGIPAVLVVQGLRSPAEVGPAGMELRAPA